MVALVGEEPKGLRVGAPPMCGPASGWYRRTQRGARTVSTSGRRDQQHVRATRIGSLRTVEEISPLSSALIDAYAATADRAAYGAEW